MNHPVGGAHPVGRMVRCQDVPVSEETAQEVSCGAPSRSVSRVLPNGKDRPGGTDWLNWPAADMMQPWLGVKSDQLPFSGR